jgi:hypothetical protein
LVLVLLEVQQMVIVVLLEAIQLLVQLLLLTAVAEEAVAVALNN